MGKACVKGGISIGAAAVVRTARRVTNALSEKSNEGRSKLDTEAINLRLTRLMTDAIDDRRRLEAALPTRLEMIRRALIQWIENERKK